MYGKNEETVLNNFDFSEIEEKDPSLAEGHHLLYDREVPFELRLEDSNGPQDVASFEAIRAKILLGGDESNPSQIRIELSCENDLFFHFTSDVDEEVFKAMQDNQKLCINFNEYTNLAKKMFNNCINDPQSYLAVFIMQRREQQDLISFRILNTNSLNYFLLTLLILLMTQSESKLPIDIMQ